MAYRSGRSSGSRLPGLQQPDIITMSDFADRMVRLLSYKFGDGLNTSIEKAPELATLRRHQIEDVNRTL